MSKRHISYIKLTEQPVAFLALASHSLAHPLVDVQCAQFKAAAHKARQHGDRDQGDKFLAGLMTGTLWHDVSSFSSLIK